MSFSLSALFARTRSTFGLVSIVALCFAIYISINDVIIVTDSVWSPHVSASLFYDQDIALNEYHRWIEGVNYYAIRVHGGDALPFFPIGGSLLTAPLVPLYRYFVDYPADAPTRLDDFLQIYGPHDKPVREMQLVSASLLCALSAIVMFRVLNDSINTAWALLGTIMYAFGTTIFSTASRAMWQHAPSVLFLALLLLALTRLHKGKRWLLLAGFAVATAYVMRPTNSISVLIVTLYVLYQYRRAAFYYFLGAALVAVPFLTFNYIVFDAILPPYFAASRLGSPLFLEALTGNLISPSRGVFVFSPFLLFIFWHSDLSQQQRSLLRLLYLIVGFHLLVISLFSHWWGGHSNGPRLFTDMMPFMVYATTITVANIKRRLPLLLFFMTAGISLFIHTNMTVYQASQNWNAAPVNIDSYPQRIWSWRDAQFLRRPEQFAAILPPEDMRFAYHEVVGQEIIRDIPVINTTNKPIYYKVMLPRGISILAAPDGEITYDAGIVNFEKRKPLEPFGIDIIQLAYHFQHFQLQSEGEIFGALALESRYVSSDSWKGLMVIKIIVEGAQSETLLLPRDIDADPVNLFALHGGGWYERETFDTFQWRWSGKEAILYVYSAAQTTASLETSVTGFYVEGERQAQGELQFLVNGEEQFWRGAANSPLSITIPLKLGWNEVRIVHPLGESMPENEQRQLGFGLDAIILRGE